MTTTRLFYARAVLVKAGLPVIPRNEQIWCAIFTGEDATAHWNPGDTTLDVPGATPYNSFGPDGKFHVWNYPSAEVGVAATVSTLEEAPYAEWRAAMAMTAGTPLDVARAFSRTPWGGVGDLLPFEIVRDWNDQRRDYVADRSAIVSGPGPWTFQSNGHPFPVK